MGQSTDEKVKGLVKSPDMVKASIQLVGTSLVTVINLFFGTGLMAGLIKGLMAIFGKVTKPKAQVAQPFVG